MLFGGPWYSSSGLMSDLVTQLSVQLAQSRHATACTWPWKHDLALRPSEVFQFVRLGAWNPLRFFLILQESHRSFTVAQEWEWGAVTLKAVTVTTELVPADFRAGSETLEGLVFSVCAKSRLYFPASTRLRFKKVWSHQGLNCSPLVLMVS